MNLFDDARRKVGLTSANERALDDAVVEELEKDAMADRQREIAGELGRTPDPYAVDQQSPRDQFEREHYNSLPTPYSTPYHEKLMKELVLSNLKEEELAVILKYQRLVNDLTYYQQPELANVFHAEMMGRLGLNRSLDGFQQRINKTTSVQTSKVIHTGTGQAPQPV